MKKWSPWLIALGAAVCVMLLAPQPTYCRLFEDGINGMRDYRFKLGISKEVAIEHFSDYAIMGLTWQVKEEAKEFFSEERIVTWIQFKNKRETLELKFVNDKLCGFLYVDWEIE